MSKALVAILVVLAVAIAYLVFANRPSVTKDDALDFVQQDMISKYPGADYEILDAQQQGGNWNIKARATFDAGTSCPSRLHAEYNYPQFGYVVREEWITRNCQVCLGLPASQCLLFFSEEAIIASHTRPGTEAVQAYLDGHGDAAPTARFFGNTGYPAGTPAYYDVWLVSWTSARDGSNFNVLLSKSQGSIIKVWGQ